MRKVLARAASLVVTAVALSCGGAPALAAGAPHLFVDGGEIAREHGMSRVVDHPRKLGRPIVGPHAGNFQPYSTVLRLGPASWRMYYDALAKDENGANTSQARFVRSRDGIHWHTPTALNLPEPTWGASVLHEHGRYRYLAWDNGMWIADSRDGITWRAPVTVRRDVSDIVSLAHFKGRYIATVKLLRAGYAVGGRNADAPHTRRIVAVTTSSDARRWSRPRVIFKPDHDPGVTEFYSVGGMVRRGDLLLGFLRVLRDDLPATPGGPVYGTGYTVLAWTRDGIHWHRDRTPFLDRSAGAGWDHAMAWADSQLQVGRQTWVYYGGYRSGHKINSTTERQIGLARMPLDRYVARVAGARRGTLLTRTVRLRGLALNARVTGDMTIRLRRGDRVVASCRVPRGNYVYRRACRLPSGSFRVQFSMHRARLYGFR